MMPLKKAAQQALEALEKLDEQELATGDIAWLGKEITALRAALADTQDWDEIEALRASLREHMAEIKRLNECLTWEQHRAEHISTHGPGCAMWGPKHYECLLQEYEAMKARIDRNADTQDWDEVEALRASLREHMAEIHRLRAAGRQALDAMDYTRWAVADYAQKWGIPRHDAAMNTLRAALAEEQDENTVQSAGGVHSWVSDRTDSGVEIVTDCHEKEGDKLSPPLDAPETNFGNMVQAVDFKEADHIPGATKMMASVREDRTVEPVLVVEKEPGYWSGGHFHRGSKPHIDPTEVWNLPIGTKLYTAPPKREPLTDEKISEIFISNGRDKETFARAIERAHGIGGEE